MSKTIIIGGDISPTNRDIVSFSNGDAESLFGDALHEIQSADYSIANLEFPVIDINSPIQKSGAVFGAQAEVLNGIKKAGINFLNLANNHIFDHGKEGLTSTLKHLENYQFDYAGAGFNRGIASEPFIKDVDGIKIGILTYCEAEFSVNDESDYGANHLDLIDFSYKIVELKKSCDFTLLLYHGGKENYIYPSPQQRKNCHFFIDFGVNLVVCQHSHTIGLHEEYNTGSIFYGQGNFLFDPYPLKKDWLYLGYLIKVVFHNRNSYNIETVPYIHNSFLDPFCIGIRLLTTDELIQNHWLNYVSNENKKLTTEYVQQQWNKLARKERQKYFSILHGSSKISRKLNEKLNYLSFFYSSDKKTILKNILNCETHLELIQTILTEDLKDE